MVTAPQDCIYVLLTSVEAIVFQVRGQVCHWDALLSLRHGLEYLHLLPIWLFCKLAPLLSASSIKLHLFVDKASEERQNFVRDVYHRLELGSKAARRSNLPHVGVRRGKDKLTELLIVDQLVHCAIIFLNHPVDILKLRAQELLVHKVVKLTARNLTVVVDIESLEELHWLKFRMASQILPPQFDQSFVCRQISK